MKEKLKELREQLDEARSRVREIDSEHAGKYLDPESADGQEWNRLNGEIDELEKTITQCEARESRVKELFDSPEHAEAGASFHTARSGVARGEDIYDLSSVRRTFGDPESGARELRDRALRAIEAAKFPHERAKREDVQGHIERLLDTSESREGDLARHLLATGGSVYARAFRKHLAGEGMSNEERAALATGSAATGGAAVPFQLDPTVVPTSNSSVNPYRAISRVVTTTSNEWRGITSAGVTARYSAEAAVVGGSGSGNDAPTLGAPTIVPERADSWIPFSMEIGQDWSGLQAEMARELQDAKDDLEAVKFTDGLGATRGEPEGILVGATTTVLTTGGEAVAAADAYALEEAVPPRFRQMSKWVANRAFYNKIRQLDSAGGSELWMRIGEGLANQVPTPGNTGAELLGYGANECSAFASTVEEDDLIAVLGDFSKYVIVDRIGMAVELVPHVFDPTTGKPTGERGLVAFWRNSAEATVPTAFRVLKVSPAGSGSGA
jgi:HK97 family phage major capsid protein